MKEQFTSGHPDSETASRAILGRLSARFPSKDRIVTIPANNSATGNKKGNEPFNQLNAERFKHLVLELVSQTRAFSRDCSEEFLSSQAEKYQWAIEEIRKSSPTRIPKTPAAQSRALARVFQPTDVVYLGRLSYDGPSPHKESLFALATEVHRHAGPLFMWSSWVASVGKRAAVRRVQPIRRNIRYHTPEDGWIFRFLATEFNMKLRAVVLNEKFLTGWFDPLERDQSEALCHWLDVLGMCDQECFSGSEYMVVPNDDMGTELLYLHLP